MTTPGTPLTPEEERLVRARQRLHSHRNLQLGCGGCQRLTEVESAAVALDAARRERVDPDLRAALEAALARRALDGPVEDSWSLWERGYRDGNREALDAILAAAEAPPATDDRDEQIEQIAAAIDPLPRRYVSLDDRAAALYDAGLRAPRPR